MRLFFKFILPTVLFLTALLLAIFYFKEPTVKILVTYHKPAVLLKSDLLVPIHVGRKVALQESKEGFLTSTQNKWLHDNMIGDDTGDNISDKNRRYSELTGLYWAWKNYDKIGNPDYIGLNHYRRQFLFNPFQPEWEKGTTIGHILPNHLEQIGLTSEKIKKILKEYDVIAYRVPTQTPQTQNPPYRALVPYKRDGVLDYQTVMKTVEEMYPHFKEDIKTYSTAHKSVWSNLALMPKETFFEYCAWLFPILETLEKNITYQNLSVKDTRILGYWAEELTGLFIQHLETRGYKIYEAPAVFIQYTEPTPTLKHLFLKNGNWQDYVVFIGEKRVCRSEKENECAVITAQNDTELTLKWDNWGEETFIKKSDDTYKLKSDVPTVKILVAYHKPAPLIRSDILVPIQVGKSIALNKSKDGHLKQEDVQWLEKNMIGDNTGNNISDKNRRYCALTAIYWAWKNYDKLGNPDYFGLNHYRRQFLLNTPSKEWEFNGYHFVIKKYTSNHLKTIGLTKENILPLLKEYDILSFKEPIEKTPREAHDRPVFTFDEVMNEVRAQYPDFEKDIQSYQIDHKYVWANMVVWKKELFFEYAEFLFNILSALEKKVDFDKLDINKQRALGYWAEDLTSLFVKHLENKGYKNKELSVVLIQNSELKPTVPHIQINYLDHISYLIFKDKNRLCTVYERKCATLIDKQEKSIRFKWDTGLTETYEMKDDNIYYFKGSHI